MSHDMSAASILVGVHNSYDIYQQLVEFFLTKRHGWYRIAILGASNLKQDHPDLQQAYELGYNLGRVGIDIVVSDAGPYSIGNAAYRGHLEAVKRYKTRARQILNSLLTPNHSGQRGYVHSNCFPHMDFFGGLASDFIVFEPDVATVHAITDFWQRIQFSIKISPEQIPPGLRLRNTAVRIGWKPRIICVGNGHWDFLRVASQTFAERGTVSRERKEHEVIQFHEKLDTVNTWVEGRFAEWERFLLANQFQAPVEHELDHESLAKIAGLVCNAWAQYELSLEGLVQRERGYYRTWVLGSHHLNPDHPHIGEAFALGRELARLGIDLLDGNGGADSVMGQAALGHIQGVIDFASKARQYGNSIKLPWEQAGQISRDRVFQHPGLIPRLDVFGMLSTDNLAFEGGVGTFLEVMFVVNLVMNSMRQPVTEICCGQRLRNDSAALGWKPEVLLVGDEQIWGYMRMAVEFFRSQGHMSSEEAGILRFYPEHNLAVSRIDERRSSWRAFLRSSATEPMN